jgi:hypothetical protein
MARAKLYKELAKCCSLRREAQTRELELREVKEHRNRAPRAVRAEIATATDLWRSIFSEISETIELTLGDTEPPHESGTCID